MQSVKRLGSAIFLPLILISATLISGCSSAPEFKSRAANLTGKSQLTEQEVLDIDPLTEITEHDIQQALKEANKDSFLIPKNSPIVLVQSGANIPDAAMQQEMMKYYNISVYSGLSPTKPKTPIARKNAEQALLPQPNYIKSLRLAAAKARQNKIVVYWGSFEQGLPDKDNTKIVWLPYHNGDILRETKYLRYSIRFATVDVKSGMWVMYTPPNTESEFINVAFQSSQNKLNQVTEVKESAYVEAAKNFAERFEKLR
ncbi:hypothetical protein [Pragia fontium]|uniref:Aminopeptidase n=1 Tax=Pragia fontium DSM 5563 = ATCC 49100 TaxID=1122977 RepID=A0AAJ4W8L4_9GAMM|nr:hypothetical protein [Pragia fontium]AKJ41614.1 hypothetical protein QQ39_05550 [Pragia fontium]SFC30751.1 hypothetical protein SAMN02745723_10224 [Pragia fontium DSM 5563 = ATCC 49100]